MSEERRSAGPGSGDSLAAPIIATVVVTTVLAALAVVARFYTRVRILHVFAVEDWMILIALVMSCGTAACFIVQAGNGLGRHISEVTLDEMVRLSLAAYISLFLYQFALLFTKLSILFLYLRVLAYSWARHASWVMVVIVVLYNIWGLYSDFTMCTPRASAWDPRVQGTCQGPQYMWAVVSLHIITDFMIFAIPLPVIGNLHLPRKQKMGLMVVFALGFIVCLLSILRAIYVKIVFLAADFTYKYAGIAEWTAVEMNMAIVVSCLAVLRPMARRVLPCFLRDRATQASSNHPANNNNNNSPRGRRASVAMQQQRQQQQHGGSGSSRHAAGSPYTPDGRPRTIGSTPSRGAMRLASEDVGVLLRTDGSTAGLGGVVGASEGMLSGDHAEQLNRAKRMRQLAAAAAAAREKEDGGDAEQLELLDGEGGGGGGRGSEEGRSSASAGGDAAKGEGEGGERAGWARVSTASSTATTAFDGGNSTVTTGTTGTRPGSASSGSVVGGGVVQDETRSGVDLERGGADRA